MSPLCLRCLKSLDERMSVKLLMRVWGPRFETVVRLLLVATFLDDSVRAVTHFSEQTEQLGEGYLKSLAETQPELVGAITKVALGLGLLAQSLGSVCLLANLRPGVAAKALIVWVIAQPLLYAQLGNLEFVAESVSIVGGLLILRAHLSEQAKRDTTLLGAPDEPDAGIARTQLFGRLLLPAVYLYRAGHILLSMFDHSLPMFLVELAVLGGIGIGCALVAAGLRSRAVALALALINLGYVCYQHPFFRFLWREGGEWKFDEAAARKSMPHVAIPKDASPDELEAWHVVDLHRYYFFQGLSTCGALLLLAQVGPGELAVEKDEVVLQDVTRVRD